MGAKHQDKIKLFSQLIFTQKILSFIVYVTHFRREHLTPHRDTNLATKLFRKKSSLTTLFVLLIVVLIFFVTFLGAQRVDDLTYTAKSFRQYLRELPKICWSQRKLDQKDAGVKKHH